MTGTDDPTGSGRVPPRFDPYAAWAEGPDQFLTDERRAARRAAEAVRALIERLAGTDAGADLLERVAADVAAVVERLPQGASGEDGMAEASLAVEHAGRLLERSPFVGRANPVAPPLRLALVEDAIECTVTFGATYEGPPGCVHGGYIAGIFDEALGAAQSLSGRAGMTGRLVVHYRSPTPLDTELRLRAELVSAEGRKIVCRGSLHAGDTLCAEAEGLFITVDLGRMLRLFGESDGPGERPAPPA